MKKHFIALLILPAVIFFGCTNYGKEKTYDGVELYHTAAITDAQADSLGNYLVESKFANGERKTVQLDKEGNTYEFRMVVKKGIDQDQSFCDMAKSYGAQLSSQIFGGAQVDVHFCDEKLKTLRVIPMSMGQ